MKKIARHRNGIAGEPFNVVTFTCPEAGEMVAILFDLEEGEKWNGRCAVMNTDELAKGIVEFGENSYRGDHYEWILREVIKQHEEKDALEMVATRL